MDGSTTRVEPPTEAPPTRRAPPLPASSPVARRPAVPPKARSPSPRAVSLAQRLGLLVAAVVVPLLILSAWAVWQAHKGLRLRAEEALLGRAEALALAIDREFDRAELLLDALAGSAALARGDLAAFEPEMRAASAAFGGAPITLVSPDAMILLSSLWAPGERRTGIPAPEVARRVLAARRAEVTDLFRAPLDGSLAVAVGIPLFAAGATDPGAEDGRTLIGGIGLSLPRERIAGMLRAAGLPGEPGWVAAVLDRSGVSVARTGPEEGIVGRPARPRTLAAFSAAPKGVIHGLPTLEGVPAVTAFARGPTSGFAYLVTMPEAAFSAPLRSALARALGGGGLVLAAGLGLAVLLSRQTVAAFRAAAAAATAGALPAGGTGLREADELGRATAWAVGERARVEAALRTADRRNAEVLASIGEPLCSLDAEGRVEYASASALGFWGKARGEILGRRFDEVFPEGIGSAAWEAKRCAAAGRTELHLCTVSPLAHRWIELDIYPRADGALTIAFRDVHDRRAASLERRRAEAALRESDARFRLVAESAPVMLWMGDEEGRCLYLNAALRAFWGVAEADDPAAFDWVATIHPEDAERLFATTGPAMAARRGFACEARYRRADGAWRVLRTVARPRFDPGGAFLGMIGVNADVTEAFEAEAALRASEERLRLAQEAGGIGAWEHDLATGRRHWSDSAYRIWGVEPGEAVTLDLILGLIHPEDIGKVREALARAADMVGPLPELQIRIRRRRDGAVRWILSRAEAVAGDDGRPVRHIGVMRDVTEQHEAMERMALLMRELDHRAKNALAVVAAAVRLTPRQDPEAFARAVEGRVRALARAHGLLAEGRWSGADLRTLAEGELAVFLTPADPQPGEAAPPRAELAGPPVRLRAEAVQAISMALHELATNATKHGALSAPGGVVRLGWEVDAVAGLLRLSWTEQGGPPIEVPPQRRGFGSRVLEATVREQLGGQVACRWSPEGLACTMAVPIARAEVAGPGAAGLGAH